jgi:hypothetical protein
MNNDRQTRGQQLGVHVAAPSDQTAEEEEQKLRKVKPTTKEAKKKSKEGRQKNKDEGGGTQRWQSELRRHATGRNQQPARRGAAFTVGTAKELSRKDCEASMSYAILAGKQGSTQGSAVSRRSNGRRKRTAGV